jgi:hypothetical protein
MSFTGTDRRLSGVEIASVKPPGARGARRRSRFRMRIASSAVRVGAERELARAWVAVALRRVVLGIVLGSPDRLLEVRPGPVGSTPTGLPGGTRAHRPGRAPGPRADTPPEAGTAFSFGPDGTGPEALAAGSKDGIMATGTD